MSRRGIVRDKGSVRIKERQTSERTRDTEEMGKEDR